MKRSLFYLFGFCLVCLQATAGVLPPEKLLPKETVLVVTVLESAKSWGDFTNSTYGKLWNDPSMKAFKESFIAKCQRELVGPTERELNIHLADYQGFAQGQLTFALLENENKSDSPYSPLLLMDSKDRSEQLKKTLAEVKKKWAEAGKPIKTVEIRGVPFTTFITTRGDLSNTLSKVFGPLKSPNKNDDDSEVEEDSKDGAPAASEKIEILFGQSDSLLIVGRSSQAIEKILNRQAGGLIPALEEDPGFHTDYEARLRGAPAYAWVNVRAILKQINHLSDDDSTSSGPLGFNPAKVLAGLGILDLKTAAWTWKNTPDGFFAQGFLGIPETNRRGIFKLLTTEAKDAAPLAFVPADVTEYMRWRLDLPQTWTGLENMLGEINPAAKGIVSFVLESAGKAKDPDYNLKAELQSSLGNDIIAYQKLPRDSKDPDNVPMLILIGSPKADKLAAALNVGIGALAPKAEVKSSEFQGRTIYSISTTQNEKAGTRFVANGGYLAISTDIGILEEYLRSSDTKAKGLNELSGLSEAAQKVGGMSTGLFGYTDQRDQMRALFESLKKNPAESGEEATPAEKSTDDWADFSLLPPYAAVAKYFSYTVYSVTFNGDGFAMTYFAPNPPPVKEKAQ